MEKLEFFVNTDGKVMIDEYGVGIREYTISDRDFSRKMLELISVQYPGAKDALDKLYESSRLNPPYYDYVRVHRFIRCNMGKLDGLSWDVNGGVLHLEEVDCPLRCECSLQGVVCKPKPFGLTEREAEVATMISSGMSYDEVSAELRIEHSTIKNILQKARKRLHLNSTKSLVKLMIGATL